ncbi:hypothetical protein PVK06_023735 [Gossypium arboreum]|uniref:Uncharacterized protein n=1 Tax=Gossypium arboreum TaxID=29729 RepID=A0ABR0PBZ1_GOSAR|nr:hypothetical protein PVK06_023735 [Gossypium arboreum]
MLLLKKESPSWSVTIPLLNDRKPIAAKHQDAVLAVTGITMSSDVGATPVRHPESVRLLPVQSGSIKTQLVRSSHRLDHQSGFTYRTQFDQFLSLGLDFGLLCPIYDLRSNFQVKLPIEPIV